MRRRSGDRFRTRGDIPEGELGAVALDAKRQGIRQREEVSESGRAERLLRKHREHSHGAAIRKKRVTREGHHSLPLRPLRIADIRIGRDVVSEERLAALRNPANLELPHRHSGVRTIEMAVKPGAGTQRQHVPCQAPASRPARNWRPSDTRAIRSRPAVSGPNHPRTQAGPRYPPARRATELAPALPYYP